MDVDIIRVLNYRRCAQSFHQYIDRRKCGKDLWGREKHSCFLEKAPPMFEKKWILWISALLSLLQTDVRDIARRKLPIVFCPWITYTDIAKGIPDISHSATLEFIEGFGFTLLPFPEKFSIYCTYQREIEKKKTSHKAFCLVQKPVSFRII